MTEEDKILRLAAPIYGSLLAATGITKLKASEEKDVKVANQIMKGMSGLAVTAALNLREAVPIIMKRAEDKKAAIEAAEAKKAELAGEEE